MKRIEASRHPGGVVRRASVLPTWASRPEEPTWT